MFGGLTKILSEPCFTSASSPFGTDLENGAGAKDDIEVKVSVDTHEENRCSEKRVVWTGRSYQTTGATDTPRFDSFGFGTGVQAGNRNNHHGGGENSNRCEKSGLGNRHDDDDYRKTFVLLLLSRRSRKRVFFSILAFL
jgi:hypothetical protein